MCKGAHFLDTDGGGGGEFNPDGADGDGGLRMAGVAETLDHGCRRLGFELHGFPLRPPFGVAVGAPEYGEGHVDFFVRDFVAPVSDHLVDGSSDSPKARGFSVDFVCHYGGGGDGGE